MMVVVIIDIFMEIIPFIYTQPDRIYLISFRFSYQKKL